jgi:hypothetical protein
MSLRRRVAASTVLLAALTVIAACATPSGSAGPTGAGDGAPDRPAPIAAAPLPSGAVVGAGTVLDDGDGAELCAIVMESYPPQCSGIPLEGWSWDGLEGAETSGDVTWGAYAVQGSYDGDTLTVSGTPVLLALYDPAPVTGPMGPGEADAQTVERALDDLRARWDARLISSGAGEGYAAVTVIWDDGSLQEEADAAYGEGVVRVDSFLRAVD